MVFIEQVDIQRIGPYLTKYLTKALFLAGFKKGQRRYTTSRDIALFVKKCSEKWDLVKLPIEIAYQQCSEPIVDEAHDPDGRLEWFRANYPTDILGSPSAPAGCDASHEQQKEPSLHRGDV
jgi:hypothetical protein